MIQIKDNTKNKKLVMELRHFALVWLMLLFTIAETRWLSSAVEPQTGKVSLRLHFLDHPIVLDAK